MKFAPLEAFDAGGLAGACAEPRWNQTLCRVNESVARFGVFHGESHWHKHDHEDELFLVLEGRLLVDLEGRPAEPGAAAGRRRAEGHCADRRLTRARRAARDAIPSDRAFGAMMRDMQSVAKRVGRSHDLAADLWRTGWYEARMVASMVDVPAYVTSAQMESWCADFDSWAIVDTVACDRPALVRLRPDAGHHSLSKLLCDRITHPDTSRVFR